MKPARVFRKLIPLAVLALAATAGVSSASNNIPTTALPLSETGEDVFDPQVAVDPSGNAFYAWVRDEPGAGTLKHIMAVRVSSTGVVGTVQTVSILTENSSSPAVAASPDGTGIVVWQEVQDGLSDRRIRSARILADGDLGVTQTVSNLADDVSDPDVGIDGTGKALITWLNLETNDTVEARTRSAADAQGAIEDAVSFGPTDVAEPSVAVAPSGDAVIAYRGIAVSEAVFFMRRLANGAYHDVDAGTAVSAVTATTKDQVQVAIDPTGDADAVVTWREDTGANNQTLARRIESTDTASIAGTSKILSVAGQDADQPQVDMDGAGNAYLTWRRSNGTITVAQERKMQSDSVLGATENLAGVGATNADQPQVAVDTAGNATFVWRFGLNVETKGLTAGGVLTPTQPLTTSGSNTDPRVDANATGARFGAYRVDTAGNDRAFGFFDLTAPVLPVAPDATPLAPTVTKKKCKKGFKLKKGKCKKKSKKKK